MEVKSIWSYLPLLVRASSKESVELILQFLWRTRKSGLDSSDRLLIVDALHLENDSDLDPLLVCLRILIRRCAYENVSKDDIERLFPDEVSPELKKLLTILLHKFRDEWRQDSSKDQVTVPRLNAMNEIMVNEESKRSADATAVTNLKLKHNTQPRGESEEKLIVTTDCLEKTDKSMHNIRDQLLDVGEPSSGDLPPETNTL